MKFPACISVLILLASSASISQEEGSTSSPPQQFPCQDHEEFREFDFWLGEWEVHVANGTFAGRNKIEKTQAGCALIENWLGASGNPGMSINYFDIAANEWVQVWSSAVGVQIDIRGGLTEDGMLLEGQINYVSNGKTAPFRGLWTPLADGRVRQYFEEYDDNAESWAPWFEGFYTKTNVEQQSSK